MTSRQLARAQRRAEARAETKRPQYESAARLALRSLLQTAAKRFEQRATVHMTAAGEGPGWTPPAEDEILSLDEIISHYRGKTDPVRQSAVRDYFATFGGEAGKHGVKANWETTNPLIAAHLERTSSQITGIAETTRRNVRGIVHRSYQEGLSVDDTAKAMREYAGSISEARAALIARTEFAGLVQGGSLAATQVVSDATGMDYLKQWRTAPGAEYPRHEDYDGLDGQTVPLDGYFDVGSDQLSYPGDPDGDPAEICNCRCDLIYVEAKDVDGSGPIAESPEVPVSQSELGSMTNASAQELAAAAHSQAIRVEPGLTAALKDIASKQGGDLSGLRFRYKSAGSMARKIAQDAAEDGVTDAVSASKIIDAVRYTVKLESGDYAAGVGRVRAELAARGFREVRVKNFWNGTEYKGINAVYETRGGYKFELQYHTPESIAAKDPGHLLYDRWRSLPVGDPERAALARQMEELWAPVKPPPGALEIGEPRAGMIAPTAPATQPLDWAFAVGERRLSQELTVVPGYEAWQKSLGSYLDPDSARATFRKYSGNASKHLNAALRGEEVLTGYEADQTDILQHAIRTSPRFEPPVTLWRGLDLEGRGQLSGEELVKLRTSAERDAATFESVADYIEGEYKVGEVLEMDGFQSTSFAVEPPLNATFGQKGIGVVFEIRASKGAFMDEELSVLPDEHEVLLAHKSRFKVVGIERRVPFQMYADEMPSSESDLVYRTVVKLEQMP